MKRGIRALIILALVIAGLFLSFLAWINVGRLGLYLNDNFFHTNKGLTAMFASLLIILGFQMHLIATIAIGINGIVRIGEIPKNEVKIATIRIKVIYIIALMIAWLFLILLSWRLIFLTIQFINILFLLVGLVVHVTGLVFFIRGIKLIGKIPKTEVKT